MAVTHYVRDEMVSNLEKQVEKTNSCLSRVRIWKYSFGNNDDDGENTDELHTLQCQAAAASGPSTSHNAAVITGCVLIINP